MLAVTKRVAGFLQRRCESWNLRLDKMSFELDGDASSKTNALRTVLATYSTTQTATHLVNACQRKERFLESLHRQHGDRFGILELVAQSRLLLHLGRASVLENVGLYCDRTTGLPLIPGTALKGVVSTWTCWRAHFNPADGSFREFNDDSTRRHNFPAEEARLADSILGDNSPNGSEHSGEVIFIGGFPVTPPKLGLDIVNPHHDIEGRPIDPKPNTFLCIEPGIRWRFAFYVRLGAPDAAQLLVATRCWIEEALTQLGIGAKTAAGYGRFAKPSPTAQPAAQNQTNPQTAPNQPQQEPPQPQPPAPPAPQTDYPNIQTFQNRVISRLNPGQLEQLKKEIELLKKPENETWLRQLKTALASRDYREIRKKLSEKDWFPKEWLPQQK